MSESAPTTFGMVLPPYREAFWATVSAMLLPAIERGGQFTLPEIERKLNDGEAQLWTARDGGRLLLAVVTEVARQGERKICTVWLAGGEDHSRWMCHLPTLEQFAKGEGCEAITAICRPGWRRLMPDYRVDQIELTKRLDGLDASEACPPVDAVEPVAFGGVKKRPRPVPWTPPARFQIPASDLAAIGEPNNSLRLIMAEVSANRDGRNAA